jgi:hypothetical protein
MMTIRAQAVKLVSQSVSQSASQLPSVGKRKNETSINAIISDVADKIDRYHR